MKSVMCAMSSLLLAGTWTPWNQTPVNAAEEGCGEVKQGECEARCRTERHSGEHRGASARAEPLATALRFRGRAADAAARQASEDARVARDGLRPQTQGISPGE